MKRFVRRSTLKYSRMGRKRPKLQRWRAAVGRHNKIRKNRYGYTKSPRIGFKKPLSETGKIKNKIPLLVRSMKDLAGANKNNIMIIARTLGTKKKIEIIKKANEMNLEILNVKMSGGQHGSK
ncbi:MAG: eL32 family ribosomal protein [Nanoarchaeota archaeon]